MTHPKTKMLLADLADLRRDLPKLAELALAAAQRLQGEDREMALRIHDLARDRAGWAVELRETVKTMDPDDVEEQFDGAGVCAECQLRHPVPGSHFCPNCP